MSKLTDNLNNLFEEIKKLEAVGNPAEASELIGTFLEMSGKPENWIYQHNKTGSNIDYKYNRPRWQVGHKKIAVQS